MKTKYNNLIKPTPRMVFITTSLTNKDGWGRYSNGIISSFANIGDCKVICVCDSPTQIENNILHINLNRKRPIDYLIKLKIIIKYTKDFKYVHGLTEKTIPIIFFLKLFSKKVTFLTLHGTYSIINFRKPISAFTKLLCYILMNGLTSGSEYTIEKIPFKGIRKKIKIIPNGVDSRFFDVNENENAERNYLLFVGALKSRKGPDLLIEALVHLQPPLDAILIGDQTNLKYVKKLKDRIIELGIENRVNFLVDVNDNDLITYYRNALSLVLPARMSVNSFEGFPMVIFEANACGTPVITTRGFGSNLAIQHGINGLLCEPESVGDLVKHIEEIYKLNYNGKMKEGCISVAKQHDWAKIIHKLLDFYTK